MPLFRTWHAGPLHAGCPTVGPRPKMRQFRHFTEAVSDLPSRRFETTTWEKRFLCSPVPAIPRMAVKCQRSPPALTKRSPF